MNTLLHTAQHNPNNGTFLYRHTPTGIQFMVEGHNLPLYLPALRRLDEGQWFHVMGDVTIITGHNTQEFKIKVQKQEDVARIMSLIRQGHELHQPRIVVSEQFFAMAYQFGKPISKE